MYKARASTRYTSILLTIIFTHDRTSSVEPNYKLKVISHHLTISSIGHVMAVRLYLNVSPEVTGREMCYPLLAADDEASALSLLFWHHHRPSPGSNDLQELLHACQWRVITVFFHHETAIGNSSSSPGQQCWQPGPQSSRPFFTFLRAWPSSCYWGKCRPSNKTIYDPV